jgi:hypothetical protein
MFMSNPLNILIRMSCRQKNNSLISIVWMYKIYFRRLYGFFYVWNIIVLKWSVHFSLVSICKRGMGKIEAKITNRLPPSLDNRCINLHQLKLYSTSDFLVDKYKKVQYYPYKTRCTSKSKKTRRDSCCINIQYTHYKSWYNIVSSQFS